ncbi:MAG: hypothetical protein ACYC00_16395, partial [Eubacteriales bacterium]
TGLIFKGERILCGRYCGTQKSDRKFADFAAYLIYCIRDIVRTAFFTSIVSHQEMIIIQVGFCDFRYKPPMTVGFNFADVS